MSTTMRLSKALAHTLLQAIPTVLGIVILSFFILQLAPGDAADVMAGESGAATAETMAALRERFGLDLPVLTQLANYLGNLARLDLGVSPRYGVPVLDLIGARLPGTLILMGLALAIALFLGIAMGAAMAAFAGRLPDRIISVFALLFYSVPSFWIGLMLIVAFSVKLGWLPSGGAGSITSRLTGLDAVLDQARYLVLPAVSLSLIYVAIYARLARAAMLEVTNQDFVRTARAKGISEFVVVFRHILRNALIPITTMAGMHVGGMLGEAVVIETVYSWPGLGRLAYEAIMARDYTVLLGILLLSSALVVLANAAIDVIQAWLDPRIGTAS